jgi:hypothetical protein
MSVEENIRAQDGFELGGEFYRWHVTDSGKDLMLIDRFTTMPIPEFFALVEDDFDRGRAPVLLAMLATSIRARHPEWSVDRIERLVLNTSLTEIVFVEADLEEDTRPPQQPDPDGPEAAAPSGSPLNGSSSSSIPAESSTSPT